MLDAADLADIQGALYRADFGLFCEAALAPLGQKPAAHHRIIISELEAIARGDNDRLMLFLPPGSAKSTYASVLFPAWFMAQKRRQMVIGASNTSTLAEAFSKRVQGVIRDMDQSLCYGVQTESASLWHATNGGQYRAAGVGGVVTGLRADLALIDDPIRGREDANSEVIREKTWNWFRTDLTTRLKPGGRVVLIQTRWHQDDLAGRLLDVERDRWRVVSLPAQAVENDPLGRSPGEWLWSDDAYGYGDLLKATLADFERAGAMMDWSALYQQNPIPMEGSLFKVGKIDILDACPAGGQIARGWDFAATAQIGTRNPDWTCGVKLARMPNGSFVVQHIERFRGGPDDVKARVYTTARQDGSGVRISIPQDPGQAGKAQVLDFTRALSGFRVESSPETGDKATRAAPVASQVNVGNLALVKGEWNRAFLDELGSFPAGVKDDQVDALSRAFAAVGLGPRPMNITSEMLRQI